MSIEDRFHQFFTRGGEAHSALAKLIESADELQRDVMSLTAAATATTPAAIVPAVPVFGVDCVVYDIEIAKCIPDPKMQHEPDLEYCRGWSDKLGMGIAVLCATDTRDMVPRVFCSDNLDEFFRLIEGRCVAGHSNTEFDDKIVEAHGGKIARSYDLLRALRKAVGEPENYTRGTTKAGRRVDDLARVNLNGMQKSMDGAFAPHEWQRNKRGKIVDYCLRDMTIELRLILQLPTLIDPVTGQTVTLELPS